MATTAWDKFLLLSWKNWIIQIRHPIQTIFEVLLPIFVCALLIVIRGLVQIDVVDTPTRYEPVSAVAIPNSSWFNVDVNHQLFYSPTNAVLGAIVGNVSEKLGFTLPVVGFANSLELLNSAHSIGPFASVEFEDGLQSIDTLPFVINYALRFPAELRQNASVANAYSSDNWLTNFKLGRDFTVGPRRRNDNDGGEPPGYIPQGFIALQNLLERQIIQEVAPGDIPDVTIQRFPYPPYIRDIIGFVLQFAFPFLFLIAFLYNCINNIKYITIEKELQLKETMKIMGLPSYMHWIAWFTKCMLFQVVIISVLTIMFKIQLTEGLAVFTHSNWFIVWLFFFFYAVAAVTYSFMFSTFFDKANIASIVGAIMWFVLLLPYNIIGQNDNASLSAKLVSSLLCNSGMGFGFMVMNEYETAGVGIQWHNLFSPVSPDDSLTVGAVMIMFLLASAIQMLIALYVEKIKPGEFGVPEKFYFPFTIRFWTGKVSAPHIDQDSLHGYNNSEFEAEPHGQVAGIQVRGLRKVYDRKVAVNNLSLNMYEDQITVLLGHNGAGKSTTMSMLTGLYQPTSGTAYIKGNDIRTDMNAIRSSLGMCPQHNVLFNELTVKEHIVFFSKLKGMKKQADIDEQIRKYVNLLELTPKLNAQSKTLSGGMKRKLSVGIALCGSSKIVLCDEPTSGMDPAARRALWDVLIQEKKGRTILLTTHFMDEADVLGDRIAIMADGDLKTVGSSFFLKKKFGVGYRLVCVKGADCDPEKITNLLASHIAGIAIETNVGSELTYVLKDEYVSQFRTIFADLETKSAQLNITSFGVSLTTMEEVFLKVGMDKKALSDDEEPEVNGDCDNNGHDNGNGYHSTIELTKGEPRFVTGFKLQWSQITALVTKKFLYSIRNYVLLSLQFVIPALFIVITMLTEQMSSGDQDLPALSISFSEYLQTVTTVARGTLATGSLMENICTNYEDIINGLPSVHSLQVANDPNFQDVILEQYRISLSDTNLKSMVGVTFDGVEIRAWFNNQAYHTAPLAINTINNAILKSVSGNATRAINLVNKPLPYTQDSRMAQLYIGTNTGFNVAFNIGFAMAFVTAMYVIFYIKERVSRAKLLQFVSGVNKIIFWFTAFVVDYVIFILISLILIGVLAAYQRDAFSSFDELARNFAVLVLFGFAVFPFTYVCSFLFHVPSTGLVRLSIGYIVSGVFCYMAFFLLNNETLELQYVAEPLGWLFLVFPHYSLARGLNNLYIKQSTINICDAQCSYFPQCSQLGVPFICESVAIDCSGDPTGTTKLLCDMKNSCCDQDFFDFSETGIGVQLVALFVIGVVSFVVLFVIEFRWLQNFYYTLRSINRRNDIPESEDGTVDSDVMTEKTVIRSITAHGDSSNNLIVKDFTKFYGNVLAVNQICVGVKKSECFGLLGVNGAGKTSVFKMLTGDETITSGEAWVEGISIKSDMNQVHQKIGYCPQFDALFDDLTGRETLKIFALLRGIPTDEIDAVSTRLAVDLSFIKHLDKRISAYSGGNKRKLSTALSMIGNPSVIYLDEPTSGMDVGARRQLWNMVIKAMNSGKSIVLTSHSMEECEVLCTRLAIMVNGEFKCLGSTQHLKNKFSKGFFLTIKIKRENSTNDPAEEQINEVKDFVNSNFTNAILKEQYMDMLTYHIPTANTQWSEMFGLMEDAKDRLSISDYSLGQTSLEQVFLFFTKYQRVSD